jgi:outer membrane lipoprotein-sorting protein
MRWLYRRAVVYFLLSFALVFAAGAADAPDIAKTSFKLDDLYRSQHSRGVMRLRIVKPERTTELVMDVWTRAQNRALVVVSKPARDKGAATLRVDENLWQYLPRISRTMRLPPSMMLSAWMGSDFTNDDLVHANSFQNDFNGRVIGRAQDPAGWLLRYEAKQGRPGLWARIDVVVNEDGSLPLQSKYYDRQGQLARTLTFSDVREFDGRKLPAKLSLQSTAHPERHTELLYDRLSFKDPVPERVFSISELEARR